MKTILIAIGVIGLAWFLQIGITIRILGAHFSVGF